MKLKILNFERIDLGEEPREHTFLDPDRIIENPDSNLDEAPVDEELFTRIMEKHQKEFKL